MIFLKLMPYIVICFILGTIIKFLNYKNIINNLCFNIMNYSKKDYDDIYIYISTYIYWFFIIIFAIIISFLQKQNILLYLFVERKYIVYIFINIFALISACKCYEKAGGINKVDDEIIYVYDFKEKN